VKSVRHLYTVSRFAGDFSHFDAPITAMCVQDVPHAAIGGLIKAIADAVQFDSILLQ